MIGGATVVAILEEILGYCMIFTLSQLFCVYFIFIILTLTYCHEKICSQENAVTKFVDRSSQLLHIKDSSHASLKDF